MNSKRAKAIRQKVYGNDYSPKFREYHKENESYKLSDIFPGRTTVLTGQIVADPRRRAYQAAKRDYM